MIGWYLRVICAVLVDISLLCHIVAVVWYSVLLLYTLCVCDGWHCLLFKVALAHFIVMQYSTCHISGIAAGCLMSLDFPLAVPLQLGY